ncbi:hypothetical protein CEXT_790871 [Caerostris extrusa]|uniref:Uncharacterized protein n=1 Tax=Caerostris extrusa TaxID=172846 RepID=A0AAV4NJW8_CAEEX|nr:hypothetical protein CEXT_790871 [Caerostris extrusa]
MSSSENEQKTNFCTQRKKKSGYFPRVNNFINRHLHLDKEDGALSVWRRAVFDNTRVVERQKTSRLRRIQLFSRKRQILKLVCPSREQCHIKRDASKSGSLKSEISSADELQVRIAAILIDVTDISEPHKTAQGSL